MTKILVVDDEPRYLRLLEANLLTEGYDVLTASDGLQAIDTFSSNPVELILLDVMMPRLDGFATCQRIRQYSNVPIIILTAKGEEQDRVKGLDLGADDYLVKPFSATELLARVRAVLRRSQVSKELGQERFFSTAICASISPGLKCGRATSRSSFQRRNTACCCNLPIMSVRS